MIGDVRHGGLEEEPQPEMYINYLQGPPVAPFIVLRTAGDPAALAERVRAEARAFDKNLPLYDMRTMQQLRSDSVAERRFMLLIIGAFGVLALVLAAIGVYGVMSLIVRADAGGRRAAGARRGAVDAAAMIVRQAADARGIGVAVGLAVAALTPLMASQLFGVPASTGHLRRGAGAAGGGCRQRRWCPPAARCASNRSER